MVMRCPTPRVPAEPVLRRGKGIGRWANQENAIPTNMGFNTGSYRMIQLNGTKQPRN